MITKKLFMDSLKAIEKYRDLESKIYDSSNGAINLLEIDELQEIIYLFTMLLSYCTKSEYDKWSGTDVEYYINEVEFGKKANQYFVTEQDGKEYRWHTSDDLWEYLVKNNPDINDESGEWEEKEKNADINIYDVLQYFKPGENKDE